MNEPSTQLEPAENRVRALQARRTLTPNQDNVQRGIGVAIWVLVAVSFLLAALAWALLLRGMP